MDNLLESGSGPYEDGLYLETEILPGRKANFFFQPGGSSSSGCITTMSPSWQLPSTQFSFIAANLCRKTPLQGRV